MISPTEYKKKRRYSVPDFISQTADTIFLLSVLHTIQEENRVMNSISAVAMAIACTFYPATADGERIADTLPDLVISSEDNYWQTGTCTEVTDENAGVIVNENDKKQLWEGFGGTFNEMGWDALSDAPSEIPAAMKLLFDADEGANFIYGRVPIGASDYAMDWYTLDETADDYEMKHFSIDRDRSYLIPFIKAALEVNPDLHLWASPWIPPLWMKDPSGNMKDDPKTLEAYALYLARFIEEYGRENIRIEAVHPQNEPGFARIRWTGPLFIAFIKNYLGPEFEERTIDAEIWCGTMSHPDDGDIAKACMNDEEAMKYVTGFGLQWNLDSIVATLSQKGRVWQTEHRCGNYNFAAKYWDQSRYDPDKPQNDHRYGEESWLHIRDWVRAGVTSYCAWNMVLDTYGKSLGKWPQNALLVVDRTAGKLIVTPAYYVFRHFSQYITPGAIHIGCGTIGINALAFLNPDGSIVTEVLNKTDSLQTMTIGIRGKGYRFEVPAHGWATLHTGAPTVSRNSSIDNQRRDNRQGVRVIHTRNGYMMTLPPSRKQRRIELLTPSGRLLESQALPEGCLKFQLSSHRDIPVGLLIARIVCGSEAATVRLFSMP